MKEDRIFKIKFQLWQKGLALLIVLIGLSCFSYKEKFKELEKLYFEVEVIQDEKVISKDKNGIVKLKKAPFKLRFSLIRTDKIFILSSWKDLSEEDRRTMTIYRVGDQTQISFAMQETIGTLEKHEIGSTNILYVGDDLGDQTIWFYDEKIDLHRLGKEKINKNEIRYSELEIEYIYDDDKKIRQKISELSDGAHLLFITMKSYEFQKEKLILKLE
jgi:hypothetical protein